jgi:alkylation response protein AidB-like acyl-CoA dehydrogenase
MDFTDPPAIAGFRAGLRAWLARELPAHAGPFGTLSDEALANTQRWYRALAQAGYVGVSLPADCGGQGLPDTYEAVINEELAVARAPTAPPVGHIAHAIADFAAAELRRRTLPGLLDCTVRWCQGFSEPGAGSDLASLTTSAVLEDDTFVVSGQKIWTSGAPWARWCLLLARTEPGAARHRGLSMLVLEMDSPGIEVRPITLANGSREFAEVFFDAVRVPRANLVGQRGQGWQIAMHMLGYERGPGDMGWVGRLGSMVSAAAEAVRAGAAAADEPLRRRLASSLVDVTVLQWHVARSLASRESGTPGAAGSIDKLLVTRVEQRLHQALADLAGASFALDEEPFADYVWSRAQSVYGGTQQIQRRIVAQRVLGLPRGPRVGSDRQREPR